MVDHFETIGWHQSRHGVDKSWSCNQFSSYKMDHFWLHNVAHIKIDLAVCWCVVMPPFQRMSSRGNFEKEGLTTMMVNLHIRSAVPMTGMSDIWVPYGALGFRGSPKFKSAVSDRISHKISSIQPWRSHDWKLGWSRCVRSSCTIRSSTSAWAGMFL